MNKRRTLKRGAVNRSNAVFVGVWVPTNIVNSIDVAVQTLDLDRSKFLRLALAEKIARDVQTTAK